MSKFYGQVEGMARTIATRRGNERSRIRSSVQSYDGSVITELRYDNDELMVTVEVADGSEFSGRKVFDGSLDEFKRKLVF